MRITREGYILYFDEPCTGSEENILLMQAGGLTETQQKSLLEHLETCEACKSLFMEYELIDEAIQDSVTSQKIKPPKEMPKKLRIMLSEASKHHLATYLQELGQAILFQKPEVCDLIRPWSKPQPLDHCVMMLNNSCTSVLNDPLMQEVGLKPEFVEDCRQFLQGLVDHPNRFMNVESAKEALDRSLSVDPDHVLTIKSFFDYYLYLSNNDNLDAINMCQRLLNLKLEPQQKYRTYLNLSTSFASAVKFPEAIEYLDMAETFHPRFQQYFTRFKVHQLQAELGVSGSQINPAIENLHKMDQSIEIDDVDPESVFVVSKWFNRHNRDIYRISGDHPDLMNIVEKYSDIIVD